MPKEPCLSEMLNLLNPCGGPRQWVCDLTAIALQCEVMWDFGHKGQQIKSWVDCYMLEDVCLFVQRDGLASVDIARSTTPVLNDSTKYI